jgi:hypothetical protein
MSSRSTGLAGRGSRITQRFYGECRAELTSDFARSRRVPTMAPRATTPSRAFEDEDDEDDDQE